MTPTAYAAPEKLTDVLSLLSANAGARILAGGQNLLVEPKRKTIAGALLVDLRKVAELSGIEQTANGIRVGATTTLSAVAASEVIRKSLAMVSEAAQASGDAQLRNRATVGGAIAAPDPAGDLLPVLMVLNATVDIAGPGNRRVTLEELYKNAASGLLSPGEVITAVTIPAVKQGTGVAYERIKHPATLFPVCGVAASVTVSGAGGVNQTRVAVVGSVQFPVCITDLGQAFSGAVPGEEALAKAAGVISDSLQTHGDHYASSEYRRHLTRVLTSRALKGAFQRATS